jgi:hypothetical protein
VYHSSLTIRIADIASTIAATVEEQGAATAEIARNVGEAAKGTAEVAEKITRVNHGASATGSASTQVLTSARSLSKESGHLKSEVENFLNTVRAACTAIRFVHAGEPWLVPSAADQPHTFSKEMAGPYLLAESLFLPLPRAACKQIVPYLQERHYVWRCSSCGTQSKLHQYRLGE